MAWLKRASAMLFRHRTPRIHLYTICWNEADILPFFFRHYDGWVDRFVIYDNGSSDQSRALLQQHPKVEVRDFPWSNPKSFVLSQQRLFDRCWRESRGRVDWVIVTDLDEHLYHPDLGGYLRACMRRGVTCIPALGYEMISDRFPQPDEWLAKSITRGTPSRKMNKLRLFDPDAVQETRFTTGCHRADPKGRIRYPHRDELLLLHYKNLGIEYRLLRNRMLSDELRPEDVEKGRGHGYVGTCEEFEALFKHEASAAIDVTAASYRPWDETLARPRWWREPWPKRQRPAGTEPVQAHQPPR